MICEKILKGRQGSLIAATIHPTPRAPKQKEDHRMTELTLFTDEVRTFISENLTPDLKRAGELCAGIYADQPVALAWHKILNNKGWAGSS